MDLSVNINRLAGIGQIAPNNGSPVSGVDENNNIIPQQDKQNPKATQLAMLMNSKLGSPLPKEQPVANLQSAVELKDDKPSFDPKPTPEQEKSMQEIVDKWGSDLAPYLAPTYSPKDVEKMVSDMITKIQTQLGRPLSNDEVKQLTENAIAGLHADNDNTFLSPGQQDWLHLDGVENQIIAKWTGTPPPAPSTLDPDEEKFIQQYAAEYHIDPDDLRKNIEEVDKRAADQLKQTHQFEKPPHCQNFQIANIARAMENNYMDPGFLDAQVDSLVKLSS